VKRLMLCVVMLAIVAGISFALEIGGSTAVASIGNAEEQRIEIDQEVDIDLGAFHFDVDGGVDYLLPTKERLWNYEIGTSYVFSVFTFGGTFAGDQDVKLGTITAYADIVHGDVGADVDFKFSADETVFQGAEFSAFWNPGPLELRLGYLWTELGAGDVNAPEVLEKGGLYGKAKISY